MTFEELRDFRRELHANPEVSTQEKETQERIYKALEKTGLSPKKTGGTGLLVHFKSEKEGNKVLLRADIDALPIEETNDFEYRSIHKGVSHKCGHDGHAAIMLGVAAELATNKPERGEVCLVFQPAEENGKGARAIIEDPEFDFKADMAFALHNLPGYPMHQVVCRKGAFTAAAKKK